MGIRNYDTNSRSQNSQISLVLLIVLGVVLIVSYASPYWTTHPTGHSGLWMAYNMNMYYERYNQWIADWIRACQVMMTIALVSWAFSTFSLCLYMFFNRYQDDRRFVFVSTVNTSITGVFALLSVITWAAGEQFGTGQVLNWAFLMAVYVALSDFIVLFFLIRELRHGRKKTADPYFTTITDTNKSFQI